jgi:predicted dehydrogenase
MTAYRNIMPGFGVTPDSSAPADFDYDMWLGPAPKRPFNAKRGIYHFRWFWDYSGGQMTNLGAHHIDIMHWYMDVLGPTGVCSVGGRLALEGTGETPDTQDAIFEYAGFTAVYSSREASLGHREGPGLCFYGTKGSLAVSRGGFEVVSDLRFPPENLIPRFRGQAVGAAQRVEVKPDPWTQAMKQPGSSDEQFDLHARNFLDCVKSRQKPISEVEDGHRVAVACHLGNISLRVGRKLKWDPVKEEIIGDREASAMLERPYRKPWDSILKNLLA